MIDKPYWFILPKSGKIGRRDSCSAVSYFLETRIDLRNDAIYSTNNITGISIRNH